jgi:thiol-disulfide isomerase/thioredoxin
MFDFATWQFEKQLVDLGICNWCKAPYLARFIIGIEYALGLAILFNVWIRRFTIPVTILLLIAFIIHLCITGSQYGFTNGNCGCFGQLIPMKPIEAIIKNILTIGLLLWIWKNVQEPKENNKFPYLLAIFFLFEWLVFMLVPFAPCKKETAITTPNTEVPMDTLSSGMEVATDVQAEIPDSTSASLATLSPRKDSVIKKVADTTKVKNTVEKNKSNAVASTPVKSSIPSPGPTAIVSKFAAKNNFGGKVIAIDQGKKLVCMFAPGCEHCQATCKELCALKAGDKNFPDVVIYFMDEEVEKIPEFFKFAGCTYPHQVLSIGDFWTMLGNGSTPGVFAQWNGNTLKSWEGINENAFKSSELGGLYKK